MDMDIMGVSMALRTYREREHLCQKEAAAKLGISRVYYCQLENAKANPSLELLSRIIHLTGTSLNTVLAHANNSDDDTCNLCHSLSKRDRKTVRRIMRRMLRC